MHDYPRLPSKQYRQTARPTVKEATGMSVLHPANRHDIEIPMTIDNDTWNQTSPSHRQRGVADQHIKILIYRHHLLTVPPQTESLIGQLTTTRTEISFLRIENNSFEVLTNDDIRIYIVCVILQNRFIFT